MKGIIIQQCELRQCAWNLEDFPRGETRRVTDFQTSWPEGILINFAKIEFCSPFGDSSCSELRGDRDGETIDVESGVGDEADDAAC